MATSSYVRRHINRLAPNVIFATRDLLSYGKRASIDQALCRLVKRGYIIRLAHGLFRREGSNAPLPPILEVAKYKAAAFGKIIIADNNNIGSEHKIYVRRLRESNVHYQWSIQCIPLWKNNDQI